MPDDSKYDVFISHSQKDESFVLELTKKLSDYGLNVFIFQKSIKAGESIPIKISQTLEVCDSIILVITEDWIKSEWSKLEVYSSLFLDPTNNNRRVIPILLGDCSIPILLRILKYLDFRNASKFESNFALLTLELSELILKKFIDQFYNIQSEEILNQSLLPWTIRGGPRIGFIIPELFVEPKIKPIKNPSAAIRFNDWLSSYKWNKNIAIVGLPGIGKSTLVKKVFFEYKNFQTKLSLSLLPLFITVRDVVEFKNTKSDNFLAFISSKLKITLSNIEPQRFFYIIDGLDEIEESLIIEIIDTIKSFMRKDNIVWITSRNDFFFNNLTSDSKFHTLFYDILEIQEWDIESDSLKFAADYSNKYNDIEIYNELVQIRKNSPNINNFLRRPFELTLILYLLSSKGNISKKTFDSSYTLYRTFYENWLQQEKFKKPNSLKPEFIRQLHKNVAIALYKNRGGNIKLNSLEKYLTAFNSSIISIKNDSSFWDLLITTKNNEEDIIERFWHETFGEFIIAEEILQSFQSLANEILENLKTVYDHEINLFVREGFQQLNENQKQTVYDNLVKTYIAEFTDTIPLELILINSSLIESLDIPLTEIKTSIDSVRIREQILYYIGRLNINSYPPILSFAANFEPSPLLKRSAILGAILYGNEDIENRYIDNLIPGSQKDKINRSVQLVYFNDVYGDIHNFEDNNMYSWEKTRNNILFRLTQNSKRDLALRWWDLRTLKCFFESRNWKDKISQENFDSIKNCLCESPFFTVERNTKVMEESSNLSSLLILKKSIKT